MSNITTDGDISIVVNDGGNSIGIIFIDGSASTTYMRKAVVFQQAVTYQSTTAFGGTVTLGANGVQLKHDLSDHTYSGTIITGVYGDTLAFGDSIYLASADGRWEKTDADAIATSGDVMLGIAVESGNDGDSKLVFLQGTIRDDSWSITSNGDQVFLSTTTGAFTQTAPSASGDVVRVAGHLTQTNNIMYFNPSPDYVSIA